VAGFYVLIKYFEQEDDYSNLRAEPSKMDELIAIISCEIYLIIFLYCAG
jgi:hypothetical protein